MSPLSTAIHKARWSLHHRGVWGSLRQAVSRLRGIERTPRPASPHPFDRQHSLDTGGFIAASHLAAGRPHALCATGYCATPPSRFAALMDRWAGSPPERPVSDYAFIDAGCGKGRALLLAAALPFHRVLGVELDPGLARIAAANIARSRSSGPHLPPIQVLCADAADLTLPDSPCLLYLYHPFSEPILNRLLDRIQASLAHRPRPLDILYCNSVHAEVIAARSAFQTLWTGVAPVAEDDAQAEPSTGREEISALFRYAP